MDLETDDVVELGRRAEAMNAARAAYSRDTCRAPSLRRWHGDPQGWLAEALDHAYVGDGWVVLMGRRVARLARVEFGSFFERQDVVQSASRRLGEEGPTWSVFETPLVDAGNLRKLVDGGATDGLFVADDEAWLALADLWGPRGPRLMSRFVLDDKVAEAA